MKRLRSGWCETGSCSRCPELLQVADARRREIHCDCPCHSERTNWQPLLRKLEDPGLEGLYEQASAERARRRKRFPGGHP